MAYESLLRQALEASNRQKDEKTDLIREAKISSNVFAKMGKEKSASLEGIGKICSLLGCHVDDILEFQPPVKNITDSGE